MPMRISDVAARIEQEHVCLKREITNIEAELIRSVTADAFAEWRMQFIWRLRDFKNHLLKHFDLEEEGGFMNEILTERPEAFAKVKKLETEHTRIVAELDEILNVLKVLESFNADELGQIRNRVGNLISLIRRHESAENRLIQSVYYREYGYPAM